MTLEGERQQERELNKKERNIFFYLRKITVTSRETENKGGKKRKNRPREKSLCCASLCWETRRQKFFSPTFFCKREKSVN